MKTLDKKELVTALSSANSQEADKAARELFRDGEKSLALLLSLEGNKSPFSGTLGHPKAASITMEPLPGTEPSEKLREKMVTLEVAGLYLISAIYHERIDFAQSPLLADLNLPPGKRVAANKSEYVSRAYESVRGWVQRCRQVGIAKLREQKEDPLHAAKLCWW